MSRKVAEAGEVKQAGESKASWERERIKKVHDRFVRRILSFPILVWRLLKWSLPPELAVLMSDRLPALVDGTFITDGEARSRPTGCGGCG